jgi:hypothetical protein
MNWARRYCMAGFDGLVVQVDFPFPRVRVDAFDDCVNFASIFHRDQQPGNPIVRELISGMRWNRGAFANSKQVAGLFRGCDGGAVASFAEERIAVFRRNYFKARGEIIDHDGGIVRRSKRQRSDAGKGAKWAPQDFRPTI